MERGRRIPAVLACLTAAVLILALGRGVRRTVRLSLPETAGILGPSIEDPDGAGGPDVIEVTPDTVQAAVATLRRPEAWSRTVAVTQYWSGGNGSSIAEVSARGPWTRVDQTLPDGRIRRCLTDGSRTWIWYGDGGAVWSGPAGGISADDEQHVPTYEDLLDLPKDRIRRAGLQSLAGDACIYVETDDGDGRTGLWWIGLDTGLLTAAERLAGGETIYRMEALPLDRTDPDPGRFLLPDGTDPAAIPEEPEVPEDLISVEMTGAGDPTSEWTPGTEDPASGQTPATGDLPDGESVPDGEGIADGEDRP